MAELADLNIIEAIGSLSATGLLILAVVALLKGWVVTKREHDGCRQMVDFWRDRALAALEAAETATERVT